MNGFDLGLKPCPGGLTHVIDKGLGPRAWQDVLETSGDYIDIVKLGWGTAYVTPNLRAKLDVLRGKPVVVGGTFFEAVVVQEKVEDYKRWLQELGLTHVEISDGVIDLPRERKLELVEEFARDFTVLSEVGSKDSEVEFTAGEWTKWLRRHPFRGAHESRSGLVHQAIRPRREPRKHRSGRGHPARDAPPWPPRRHVEGGAVWRPRRHSSFLTSTR